MLVCFNLETFWSNWLHIYAFYCASDMNIDIECFIQTCIFEYSQLKGLFIIEPIQNMDVM